MRIGTKFCVAALLLLAALEQFAGAADRESAQTVITIEGMTCAGCARKIASALKKVPGVQDVQMDVEAGTAIVSAGAESEPSPRALWRAVVKARYKPVRLDGPGGSFTGEPRS